MTFGLGAGILNKQDSNINNFNFDLNASYDFLGASFPIKSNFEYSLEEIEQRSKKTIPGVMPLVQLSFGLKANLSERFNINTEVGIYNGLHAKLGTGFRF